MSKKKTAPAMKLPRSVKELPASQGMLQLVRSELKSDISGLRSETKAGFAQVDSRFNLIESKLAQVLSEVARVGVSIEEQNSRNQVVLEGLTNLYHRQERADARSEEVRSLVQTLALRSRR